MHLTCGNKVAVCPRECVRRQRHEFAQYYLLKRSTLLPCRQACLDAVPIRHFITSHVVCVHTPRRYTLANDRPCTATPLTSWDDGLKPMVFDYKPGCITDPIHLRRATESPAVKHTRHGEKLKARAASHYTNYTPPRGARPQIAESPKWAVTKVAQVPGMHEIPPVKAPAHAAKMHTVTSNYQLGAYKPPKKELVRPATAPSPRCELVLHGLGVWNCVCEWWVCHVCGTVCASDVCCKCVGCVCGIVSVSAFVCMCVACATVRPDEPKNIQRYRAVDSRSVLAGAGLRWSQASRVIRH